MCHHGKIRSEGHYTCYILERMESKMKYHFLDDAHHSLVNHVSFSEDVNRHGYLFLYGKKKVSSFLGNPYSGHRSEFMSLEKDYLHSFKKRQPSRVTKASRQSDIGVSPKTQLSQILSVEPETLFGMERNESEEDTNSILEIEETDVENVDYLHPRKVNKVKQVDSNIDKITLKGCQGKSSTHAVLPKDSTPLQDQESSSILSLNVHYVRVGISHNKFKVFYSVGSTDRISKTCNGSRELSSGFKPVSHFRNKILESSRRRLRLNK